MDGLNFDFFPPLLTSPWFVGGVLLLSITVHRVSRLLAERLRPEGILPRAVRWLSRVARLVAVVFAVWLALVLTPAWMGPVLPYLGAAAFVVVLVAARNVLPDLFAGAVLFAERRVRRGRFVRGPGFEGMVERVQPRATTIRDASGRRTDIPNRRLLEGPVESTDRPFMTHEVRVVVTGEHAPELVRAALEEAVLCTPWTPLEPEVAVRRDESSDRWVVRTRLLDVRYVPQFDAAIAALAAKALRLADAPSEPV